MHRNDQYVDVDDIWEKGLKSGVEFRTNEDTREIVNYSRIEELYSEAIKAMRTYSVNSDVCSLEEELYENDN